jgi:Bacterial cell division membrane protein
VLALATVLADLPDRETRPRPAQLLLALGAAAIPLGLVLLQPDLGTFLILAVTVLGMLALAGTRPLWIALMLLGGVAVSALAWWLHLLQPHQIRRLTAFADPSADPQGVGYNATQALVTVGSGGTFGRGLFHGDQTGGRFVPEQHTDFIFTAAGEELGFLGATAVLVLLWIVLWRGLRIASRAESPFGALAAGGIVCWLAVQTFVNVGMTIGLAPIVGVPLPFLSYGGSSAISCLLAMGVLQAAHRHDTIRL